LSCSEITRVRKRWLLGVIRAFLVFVLVAIAYDDDDAVNDDDDDGDVVDDAVNDDDDDGDGDGDGNAGGMHKHSALDRNLIKIRGRRGNVALPLLSRGLVPPSLRL